MVRGIAAVTVLSTGFIVGAFAQQLRSDDPILGVWELDPAASSFITREPPRAETRIYKAHPLGIEERIITVSQQGVRRELGYTGSMDRGSHPAYGIEEAERVQLHRIAPRKAEAVFTHAGMEVGRTVRELSLDGSRLTVELIWKGDLVSRAVYRKQDTDTPPSE